MLNLYNLPEIKFPDNFIWGSATAGHQIEGDNVNSQQWHAELADPAEYIEPSGKACDGYRLYKEDIRLLKDLGHRAYRFSIEWSRLEPEEGRHDSAALEHYIDLLERLKEAGIFTCVTLLHYTYPKWFGDKGGWQKEENIRYFIQHIHYLAPKIAHLTDQWCVINEFNMGGIQKSDEKINQLKAHGLGYRAIKEYSAAPVSSAHAFLHKVPQRANDGFDKILTDFGDWADNEFFFHAIRTGEIIFPFRDMEYVEELKGSCDYWAINYYNRHIISARSGKGRVRTFAFNRYRMIDASFYNDEFTPESLISNLSRLTDKPVHITENGQCCDDDRFRILSLVLNLTALSEARRLYGLDIRSYYYWSLMDNYEWQSFKPRFGLVHVDFATFERTPKPSATFYREIIKNNGIDGKMIEKYLPELPKFKLYDHTLN